MLLKPTLQLGSRRTKPTSTSITSPPLPSSSEFSLLTNPFCLIILLGLLAVWLFERETFGVLVLAVASHLFRPSDPSLVVLSRRISEWETLGVLNVCSIVVIFLTNVGSILISVLLAGIAIVCFHDVFETPENLFLDE
ncbi:hypothetical protein L6452_06525 [Arctium lappa]|uniref:Uncharacterized protein n=1 Tax=Arctium lappa TaxID=4217 RepID=A0ACB9EKG6_ARCLA|nr:hypothetical protein L6452_06525 [Arctium lappa]